MAVSNIMTTHNRRLLTNLKFSEVNKMNDFRKIKNKIFAYKYALKHNSPEQCTRIISELEAENFHEVVKCLLAEDYEGAYKAIN